MKMTKEEREEFRRILKDCQDINGDNAFDILVDFIRNNLEEEEIEDTKELIAEALKEELERELEKIYKQHIEDLKNMPVVEK